MDNKKESWQKLRTRFLFDTSPSIVIREFVKRLNIPNSRMIILRLVFSFKGLHAINIKIIVSPVIVNN